MLKQFTRIWLTILLGMITLGVVGNLTACKSPGDHMEDAGENLGDAVEDVGDAVEDATD